jgi:exonuclease SbcD
MCCRLGDDVKILHLSDLHLGKCLHDVSLIDDQRHVLGQAERLVETAEVDVVAITGDVYDRMVPPVEAQTLLDDFVVRVLANPRVHVVIIPGNHDSAERLGFARRLLGSSRLHIAGAGVAIEPLVLHDADGPVTFYPIPYIAPANFRAFVDGDPPQSFTSIYETVLARLPPPPPRSVCLAHCFAANGVATGDHDEKPLWIGGIQVTDPVVFAPFTLTLLGHLHRPQQITPQVFYAGSLLPYTFNESAGASAFSLYDVGPDGFTCHTVPIARLRQVGRLTGSLEEILTREPGGVCTDLVEIVLTDRHLAYGFREQVKARYSASFIRWQPPRVESDDPSTQAHDLRQRSEAQVLEDFFRSVQVELDDTDRKLVASVLDDLLITEGRE